MEESLTKHIKTLRLKIKFWFLLDGISRLVIYLGLYLIFTFLVDFILRDLPLTLRLSFLITAITIFFFTFLHRVVIPFIKLNKIPDDSLILLIERQFPDLKERLINLYQLSELGNTLKSHLINEVASISKDYKFSKVISPFAVKRLALIALSLVLISLLAITNYPADFSIWGKRLFGANIKWPKRTHLLVKVIPDYVVAKGQTLSVLAYPIKGPRLNSVYIKTDLLTWQKMTLSQKINPETKNPTREFRYDFPKVQSSFRLIVKGGDDQTDWINIKVLIAPFLECLTTFYEYPSYTGLPNKTEISGNIKATRGTKVTLIGHSNIKLLSATLKATTDENKEPIEEKLIISDTETASLITSQLLVDNDKKYSIHLLATNHIKNYDPIEYSIKVITDNHPTIQVIEPQNTIEYITPDGSILLSAKISDDYGISDCGIKLSVIDSTIDEAKKKEMFISPLQITAPYRKDVYLSHQLSITDYNLKEGNYLILNFTAGDNCEIPASQTSTSPDYTLMVIPKSQMERKIEETLLQIKDDIKKTLQFQESALNTRTTNPHQSLSSQRRVTQNSQNTHSSLSRIIKDIKQNKLFSGSTLDKLEFINQLLSDIYTTKSPNTSQLLEKLTTQENKTLSDFTHQKQTEIKDDLSKILSALEEWEDYQEVINLAKELLSSAKKTSNRIKEGVDKEPPCTERSEPVIEQSQNLLKESTTLENKMQRVSEKLKQEHPYYSEKLQEGLEKLKENALKENIVALISHLQAGLSGQALKSLDNIQTTLTSLINLLEERITPEELYQKLQELITLLNKVGTLKEEEEKVLKETLKILDPSGDIFAVAEELDSLILDQKALNEATNRVLRDESFNVQGLKDAQKELQMSAEDLAERLKSRFSGTDDQNRPAIEKASQSLSDSASQMAESIKNLSSEKEPQPQVSENQKSALDKLRQARASLKEFLDRQLTQEEKRKLERLTRRQKEIEQDTQKTAQETKDKQHQNSLKKAKNSMAQAQNALSQFKPKDAVKDEQDAIEELERLYETIAQKIDKLNQDKQQKTLEELHTTLKNITKQQSNINNRTEEILSDKTCLKSRECLIALKKLSVEQLQLADETKELKTRLDKEDSVVYSPVLNYTIEDMKTSSRLLAGDSSNETESIFTNPDYLLEIQTDISTKLKELLKALEFEKNRRKPLQMTEAQNQKEQDKLLPLLSELKMIRTIQENIITRTRDIQKELLNNPDNPVLSSILQRLSAQQAHLTELTKAMLEKIKQLQQP
jgi:hypothetical protein